jgi:hypothetical protein
MRLQKTKQLRAVTYDKKATISSGRPRDGQNGWEPSDFE